MLLTAYRRAPSVYRLRAGTKTDSYGETVESWTTPERSLLRGATVQTVSVVEEEGVARHITKGQKRLYAPGAVDLTAADRIEVDGEIWQVDGDPVARAGLASTVYTTAALKRVSIG
ncbi:head closure Hc1 [Arthrobacter phage Adumb2043]|uniref:Head-to-tail stopper n=1 Tax=Arthrobacter phage Adumb2043 TaxID=2776851 RepID=A0A7M1CKW5_9CAUD|nr:head closure Hc1 [Arthrobacter phage Adumb2043]QOP65070.1 head-to-tail stopper [Arthrobacter phage Adumb2043]